MIKIKITDKTLSSRIREHVSSDTHGDNIIKKKPQPFISDAFRSVKEEQQRQSEFNRILGKGLMAADIPLEKLSNPSFRKMLQRISGRKIPHPNTIRGTIVSELSESVVEKIKERIKGRQVYFIVDETTDPASRFCTNIMVGPLDGTKCKAMLINVCFNDDNNNRTVQQAILEACHILWPDKNVYDDLVLIVSDQARYMLLAISQIKQNSLVFPSSSLSRNLSGSCTQSGCK